MGHIICSNLIRKRTCIIGISGLSEFGTTIIRPLVTALYRNSILPCPLMLMLRTLYFQKIPLTLFVLIISMTTEFWRNMAFTPPILKPAKSTGQQSMTGFDIHPSPQEMTAFLTQLLMVLTRRYLNQ